MKTHHLTKVLKTLCRLILCLSLGQKKRKSSTRCFYWKNNYNYFVIGESYSIALKRIECINTYSQSSALDSNLCKQTAHKILCIICYIVCVCESDRKTVNYSLSEHIVPFHYYAHCGILINLTKTKSP